jgi:hypothetical protein
MLNSNPQSSSPRSKSPPHPGNSGLGPFSPAATRLKTCIAFMSCAWPLLSSATGPCSANGAAADHRAPSASPALTATTRPRRREHGAASKSARPGPPCFQVKTRERAARTQRLRFRLPDCFEKFAIKDFMRRSPKHGAGGHTISRLG